MKIKYVTLQIFALITVLYLLLITSYLLIEVKEYAYTGFRFEWSLYKFIIGIFLIITIALHCLTIKRSQFIIFILTTYFIFFLIPNIIFFQFYPEYNYNIFISYFIIYIGIYFFSKFSFSVKVPLLPFEKYPWSLFIIALCLSIPFMYIYGGSIKLENLLLINVYETRAAHTDLGTFYTSYFYSALTKFLVPIVIIIAFYRRQRLIIFAGSLLLIFLFLCGAHKSVLFFLFLTILFFFGNHFVKLRSLLLILVTLSLISLLSFFLFSNLYPEAVFVQRTFFLNSLLDVFYVEFFSGKHLYWSDSFLGRFINYPFSQEPAFIIGAEYFPEIDDSQANNGVVSDGLINFGLVGVILNSVFIGLMFGFFNSLRISHRFMGVFFIVLITLKNSPLPISMLTHGIFILIFISVFVLKNTSLRLDK